MEKEEKVELDNILKEVSMLDVVSYLAEVCHDYAKQYESRTWKELGDRLMDIVKEPWR